MKRRACPYFVSVLLALLLSLLPCAIAFDLATPFGLFENWYWEGQPSPRPVFSAEHLPPILRAEQVVFRALVTPPAHALQALGGHPTTYSLPYTAPNIITEAWAHLPPIAIALDHLRAAIPFWVVMLILFVEVTLIIRERFSRAKQVA
jgi:hypothetical protein